MGHDKLDAMLWSFLGSFLGAATPDSGSVPPSTVPDAPGDGVGGGSNSTVSDVISTMVDNVTESGYQTGVALVVTTIAIVAMLNLKVQKAVLIPVAVGAFWAGWLGWNTFTGQDNPLFPGDVSATKLWDLATTGETGFLLVVIVGCVAAVFLWRKGTTLPSRIALLFGAVLGASFVYNLVEAFRYS